MFITEREYRIITYNNNTKYQIGPLTINLDFYKILNFSLNI